MCGAWGIRTCAVLGVIYLTTNHKISFRVGLGDTAKWKALAIPMRMEKERDITIIQVLSDSKLVIDWINGAIR